MEPTAKVLRFIAESGMSDAQFTREAGISNGLIGQWRSGKQKASLKNIQKISDRFGVDVSVFVGGDDEPIKTASSRHQKLAETIMRMDEETLLKLEKLIDIVMEGKQ